MPALYWAIDIPRMVLYRPRLSVPAISSQFHQAGKPGHSVAQAIVHRSIRHQVRRSRMQIPEQHSIIMDVMESLIDEFLQIAIANKWHSEG
jgi:hypothetical protein